MNKEDIIRMARETGLLTEHNYREIINFGSMVVAAEREACAKVCDEQEKRSRESSEKARRERDQFMYHHCAVTAKWNAEAIRARGQ